MTCKECVHCKVCFAVATVGKFKENAECCKNFKNKADFVEVVRCKDCAKKVDYKGRVMCSKNARVICGELCGLTATSDEHFCGYGERRDTNA